MILSLSLELLWNEDRNTVLGNKSACKVKKSLLDALGSKMGTPLCRSNEILRKVAEHRHFL